MKYSQKNTPDRPYLSYEHQTHDNIVKTARYLKDQLTNQLKQFDLDLPLFNILRIIHEKTDRAINIKEIQTSMVYKMANTSRLIRVLEDRQLIERMPSEEDKRVVNVLLTDKGSFVMDELTDLTTRFYTEEFSRFTKEEMDSLNEILWKLRNQ